MIPKQVIIVRKELNMRKGKIAAQVAHASMKVLLDMMSVTMIGYRSDIKNRCLTLNVDDPINLWLDGSFTKIVVGATDEEFETLYQDLMTQNVVPFAKITDNGQTEFGGVKTDTCIAIGPADPNVIDVYTKQFKLM